MMKKIFTLLAAFFILNNINAQIYWDFATATPTSGVPGNITVSGISQGNNSGTTALLTTTSGSTGYAGSSGTNNAGAAAIAAGTTLNPATSTYFEITFTPSAGYEVQISNISFGSRSTATGPQLLTIRSSIDGYTTDAGSIATSNNSTWALLSPTLSPLNGGTNNSVTLRIYGSNGAGTSPNGTANWRIDDLSISLVSVLPIKLTSFTAINKVNSVGLNWNVALESGITTYEVERSINGTNFTKIATINAQNLASYTAIDNSPVTGNNYYRLKINENNGTFTYSAIQKVKMNGKALTINALYPSPAKDFVKININNTAAANATIEIVDFNGKTVLNNNTTVNNGLTEKTINISTLKNGIYIVKVSANGETANEKFVKQ